MNIPVKEIIDNIVGRGQVVVCEFPAELMPYNPEKECYVSTVHIGDAAIVNNEKYIIKSIESWTFSRNVGLIFNKRIPSDIKNIEIFKQ